MRSATPLIHCNMTIWVGRGGGGKNPIWRLGVQFIVRVHTRRDSPPHRQIQYVNHFDAKWHLNIYSISRNRITCWRDVAGGGILVLYQSRWIYIIRIVHQLCRIATDRIQLRAQIEFAENEIKAENGELVSVLVARTLHTATVKGTNRSKFTSHFYPGLVCECTWNRNPSLGMARTRTHTWCKRNRKSENNRRPNN